MIVAHGLGRSFGARLAVDDVSLHVADGTLLALLGPNGAGKTTTVRMLSGLLAPSTGSAVVAGRDVVADPAGVRARIGLVTDVPGLYDQMSPSAYLHFFGQLYGIEPRSRAERVDQLLHTFELDTRRHDKMVTFSRGMQQKVALARALLHEPSVLFLDEPTAGLDPLAARAVRELIVRLKHARRSIVLCTHDLDEAERLADQVAIMRAGRIVALDAPTRLRETASPETCVRVTLAAPYPSSAPAGVLEFQTTNPTQTNPRVIADLVAEGAQVISVTCSTLTLEDVYATALNGHPKAVAPTALSLQAPDVVRVGSAKPGPDDPDQTSSCTPPSDALALWLIARRAAIESLNDRMTRLMNVFFAIVAPIALLVLAIKPLVAAVADIVPTALPFYLLVIGMMPAVGAVGIAAGQFAGEKERGLLTPMLASPTSNLAIFGGKVLGSILPPIVYSIIAEVIYILGIVVLLGPDQLALLPPALSVALILLVPLATCLAAIIGALVSSRVPTYNAAQQISGLLLIPVWGALFAAAFRLQDWGSAGLILSVGGLAIVDVALVLLAASTWRREDVLSQR